LTDWVQTAWVVPLWLDDVVAGHALFLDAIVGYLEKIFEDDLEAIQHLRPIGEVQREIHRGDGSEWQRT
jgi:hypothetical protein